MKIKSTHLIKPNAHVRLAKKSTSDTGNYKSEEAAAAALVKHRTQLAALQDVFYASQTKALLIVLQGMDTAGKDGTISHIFSGINPQGCDVAAFKVPTPLEARHDFLWRAHAQVPPRGMINIFNRSHYEDVLSPRVHKLITDKVMRRRLDDINQFESMLFDNDVLILKFYLHISRDEQTRRLQSRIDDKQKHWKLSEADLHERKFWPQYIDAYDRILSTTSPKLAPWFVIPADHKWYRNIAISTILVDALQSLKLKFPDPTLDASTIKL
ncbi:PPK2 family polyphosphate kinase [Tunturibacter empetritectus]|uniref:PPK2 family polyphosphate:nucleotide phosphotransferase n=1 Tax=Tunturiibacter lichenicola TaxID=2051959 RepID=A0A7W8J6N1_9BACT|nr:PPK2 family polyphosphate kinase [Edaphobacter lichenicola]MBB5343614.1 PPK2 family polyphosphate:nucleotide phosphotransferase [Edaphobacter lichenicola]